MAALISTPGFCIHALKSKKPSSLLDLSSIPRTPDNLNRARIHWRHELLCAASIIPYSLGMWLVLTLVLVGAALLLLETILPGLIAGILGLCCLIAGVAVGYMEFGMRTGNWILLGVSLGLVLGTAIWLRYFPGSRIARMFISQKVIGELKVEKPELLDQVGVAITNLRPSGTALINGKRVDVVTEGGMVERGASVKVVAVEGMRIVVRAISGNEKGNTYDKL